MKETKQKPQKKEKRSSIKQVESHSDNEERIKKYRIMAAHQDDWTLGYSDYDVFRK